MTESDEEKMGMALSHKERGNELFKSGEHESAIDEYAAGLGVLERCSVGKSPGDDEDVEVVSLRMSLLLNRATCLSRLDRWQEAADCANRALEFDASNVKARYRLGLARSRLGQLSAAAKELTRVLELESTNKDAKRELILVRQEMSARKVEEKKRIENALKKGLYGDVEAERARRRAQDEAKMAVKRQRFNRANEERKALGQAELSFEDWTKKEEEETRKNNERIKKEKERQQRERDEKRRLERVANGGSSSDVVVLEDEEVDDDCRGYKVLADGRKTSYFTQVPDDATREMLEKQSGPKKLDSSSSADDGDALQRQPSSSSGSAWNAAGTTFEERSLTKWADDALKKHLSSVQVDCGGCSIKISSIEKLEGEASIVYSRRVPKYIFDYVATLEWEATVTTSSSFFGGTEKNSETYKGSIHVPELSSVVNDHKYEQRLTFKKKRGQDQLGGHDAIPRLHAAINEAITSFVEEYRKK